MSIQRVLEIDCKILPEEIRQGLNLEEERTEYWSEIVTVPGEPWSKVSHKFFEEYHRKVKIQDDFEGSIKEMIEEYDLEFDYWLVQKRISLAGIDRIVIVCMNGS